MKTKRSESNTVGKSDRRRLIDQGDDMSETRRKRSGMGRNQAETGREGAARGQKVRHRRPGRQIGPPPSRAALVRLYVEGNQTARDVAAALGCSKDMVIRSLKDYRIKVRTRTKRSKLLAIDLAVLEAGVRDKGVRGYARDIGVDESTLRHHLKVRRCQ